MGELRASCQRAAILVTRVQTITQSFVMVPMLRGCVARRCVQLLAWRFAPHNHAEQADIGRQSLRLFRPRGLSATPVDHKHETSEATRNTYHRS